MYVEDEVDVNKYEVEKDVERERVDDVVATCESRRVGIGSEAFPLLLFPKRNRSTQHTQPNLRSL